MIKSFQTIEKMKTYFSLVTRAGVVIAILLGVGCMFKDVKKEIQEEKITYSLFGRVEGISQTQADVFVLLYAKKDKGLHLERYTLPDDTRTYSFIVIAAKAVCSWPTTTVPSRCPAS